MQYSPKNRCSLSNKPSVTLFVTNLQTLKKNCEEAHEKLHLKSDS